MAGADQITADVLAGADKIPERLLLARRDTHRL